MVWPRHEGRRTRSTSDKYVGMMYVGSQLTAVNVHHMMITTTRLYPDSKVQISKVKMLCGQVVLTQKCFQKPQCINASQLLH